MKSRMSLYASWLQHRDVYLKNSPMPGARYVLCTEHSVIRCVWHIILLVNLTVALLVVANLWDQFYENSTITAVEVKRQGTSLGFPSVFICPKFALNELQLLKFMQNIKSEYNLSISLNDLSDCTKKLVNYQRYGRFALKDCADVIEVFKERSIANKLVALYIRADEYFRNCFFGGFSIDCGSNFYSFFSEIGYCFVFNNIHAKNFFNAMLNEEPGGLLYEYDRDWSLRFEMLEINEAIMIYLKGYYDLLTLKDRWDFMWHQDKLSSLKFEITENYCTPDVRDISLNQRGCLFSDEPAPYELYNSIFADTFYNQDICRTVCHAESFFKYCTCIPTHYKIQFPNLNFPMCNFHNLDCYQEHYKNVTMIPCENCPNDCNSLKYATYREPRNKTKLKKWEGARAEPMETFLPLTIDLKVWPMMIFKTSVIFGWIELLVSFGGVVGLFIGFSFISSLEFIYYGTMRIICLKYMAKSAPTRAKLERPLEQPLEPIPCIELSLKPLSRSWESLQ